MATFLSLVNEVLARLREDPVSSVTQTPYSTMIGYYVNDAKRQVEDAWDWDALTSSIPVTVGTGLGYSGSSTRYVVPGSGTRFKNVFVNNISNGFKHPVRPIGYETLLTYEQMATTVITAPPRWFSWYGNNGTDAIVAIYPTPSATFNLSFNMNVPQVDLTANTDILLIPSDPVVAGAFARALVERGEDGGLSSSEAYGLYKGILADRIAIEQARSPEYDMWEVV
jgi:hypothetical protein